LGELLTFEPGNAQLLALVADLEKRQSHKQARYFAVPLWTN
jgi:hypothetical protein